MATAAMAKPGRLINSRFTGTKCSAGDRCTRGGTITRGALIRWIAGNRFSKALTYHDDCFDMLWEQGLIAAGAGGEGTGTAQETGLGRDSFNGGNSGDTNASGFELRGEETQTSLLGDESLTVSNGHSNGKSNGVVSSSSSPEPWLNGLADSLAPFIEKRISTKLDSSEVERIVADSLAASGRVCTVTLRDNETGETRDLGVQHKCLADLLRVAQSRTSDGFRLNAWLAGPAGSGKTTAAKRVAEALGLAFHAHGAMDSSFQLLGYNDAQGRYVRTEFREAYEHGGVCLLDEVDSWSPSAQLALNGALANGECSFPDGMINRHPDFVCVACANTWGLGGTNDYVGRLKLDAAFLDRFVQIDWPIDEDLESATCGNLAWSKRVQEIRARVRAKGIKVVLSPRASYYGAALLASGMAQERVEVLAIRKGMNDSDWASVSGSY